VSHRSFSSLTAGELWAEIIWSKTVLENGLKKAVEVFAFPFGDAGLKPEETAGMLAAAGYEAACLYGGSSNSVPPESPYLLERLPVGPETDVVSALRQR
jgi:hypothetical protein